MAARVLVVIKTGGSIVVRPFNGARESVVDFDAGTEKGVQVIASLVATRGAAGPRWDRALEGHRAAKRRAAEVDRLDV